MLPNKPPVTDRTQRWTFPQLSGLVKRNPLMISRWVLRWAGLGTFCGLFAALYWNLLEMMIHALDRIQL